MPTLRDIAWRMLHRPHGVSLQPRTPASALITRAAPQAVGQNDPAVSATYFRQAQTRGLMPEEGRSFAESNEWVRTCINLIKARVGRGERAIVPIDPEKPYSEELQARIAFLIENPNPRGDSWRAFIEPVVTDLLTLGRGGWEYVRNMKGWPLALIPFDAAYMHVISDWDGTNLKAPRYAWTPMGKKVAEFRNDQVTLMLMNSTTYRPEGLSPLETLRNSIEADAASSGYIRSLLQKYPPPGLLNLGPRATAKTVRAVAEQIQSEVLGNGGMLVLGNLEGVAYSSMWAGGSRENQLQEWTVYFARKIAAVYGLSPQDLGITFDVNRATAEVMSDKTTEDGVKSALMLVEEYVNREIVGKFGAPELINLAFRYKELSQRDRERQVELAMKLSGGLPVMMWNEIRSNELDLEPLELGNAIYIKTMEGAVALLGDDAEAFNRQKEEQAARRREQEAALHQQPDENPSTTPDKSPKGSAASSASDADAAGSGAQSQEQEQTAGNRPPPGASGSGRTSTSTSKSTS